MRLKLCLAILLGLNAMSTEIQAGFLAGGATRPDFGGIDGTVNHAVYVRNDDGTFGTGADMADAFVGTGVFGEGKYLYLYQVVNESFTANPGATHDVSGIQVSLNGDGPGAVGTGAPIRSLGYFSGLSFFDTDGEVKTGNALGSPDPGASPDPPSPTPPNLDFTLGSHISISAANPGAGVGVGDPAYSPAFTFKNSDSVEWRWDPNLILDERSIIVGFTSDIAPHFGDVTIRDGGSSTIGTVLTIGGPDNIPLPEPGTFALILTALPGLGVYLRRRRNQAPTQA